MVNTNGTDIMENQTDPAIMPLTIPEEDMIVMPTDDPAWDGTNSTPGSVIQNNDGADGPLIDPQMVNDEIQNQEGSSQVGVAVLDRSEMPDSNAWVWWVVGILVVIVVIVAVIVGMTNKNKKQELKKEEPDKTEQ